MNSPTVSWLRGITIKEPLVATSEVSFFIGSEPVEMESYEIAGPEVDENGKAKVGSRSRLLIRLSRKESEESDEIM